MLGLIRTIVAARKLAVAIAACGLFVSAASAVSADGFELAVDDNGAIRLPDMDYRKDWSSIGAWAVAADEDGQEGSKGIHVVYTQPNTVDFYRKNGTFPDGAILIKELLTAKTKHMSTGLISRADQVEGWFVMIKDSGNRYSGNPLWGDGWGWAYFGPNDRTKTTTKNYLAQCKGCHIPAKKTDWIYTEAYPALTGK
jgi:hypothetical protein